MRVKSAEYDHPKPQELLGLVFLPHFFYPPITTYMPNLDQAKKALRASVHKRETNDRWRKKLRENLKALRLAVTAQDKKAAEATFVKVSSLLDRAARHHILHPNKAARRKSRLAKAVAKIAK